SYFFGASIAILKVVKLTTLTYLLPYYIVLLLTQDTNSKRLVFTTRFLFGFFLIQSVASINNYIMYGGIIPLQGYDYSYSLNYLINLTAWKATYLYPKSFFLHSSILLFFVILVGYYCFNIIKTKSFTLMSVF